MIFSLHQGWVVMSIALHIIISSIYKIVSINELHSPFLIEYRTRERDHEREWDATEHSLQGQVEEWSVPAFTFQAAHQQRQ